MSDGSDDGSGIATGLSQSASGKLMIAEVSFLKNCSQQ